MPMKFNTFSIVVGNDACNARCDFCVAKMTEQLNLSCRQVDRIDRIFNIACRLADKADVTTALLTSKGEPTLFPNQITEYLIGLEGHNFPLVELQTNGLDFIKNKDKWSSILPDWRYHGLTTIALSIVHYDNEMNKRIYCNDDQGYRFSYPDLTKTIDFLVDLGFSIRLNCIGIKGYIDSVEEIENLLNFARKYPKKKLQVTWRPVQLPEASRSDKVAKRTRELEIDSNSQNLISIWAQLSGRVLHKLPHGAIVYDIDGQNFCLSNCLTIQPDLDEVRQVIYVDGGIIYDWQYAGAIIL